MQFIQEEMENFLAHLARSGEHDKQVRTMNQVGLLAQDCNCTDLYLYGCTAGTRTSTAPRAGSGATSGGFTRDDEEGSEDHDHLVVATTTRTLDDHVKAKLLKWFDEIPPGAGKTFSVAIIVEPDTYQEALALARDTLVLQPTYNRAGYHRDILVNIPAVHLSDLPLRPKEVLYYILRELKLACQIPIPGTGHRSRRR